MNSKNQKLSAAVITLVTAAVCLSTSLARSDEGEQDAQRSGEEVRKMIEVTVTGTGDELNEEIEIKVDDQPVEPGKFWIGVMCQPLDQELLKLHFGIDQALVVSQVVEESPAEAAGLQPNDILLQVGDTQLSDIKALVASIEESQGKEIVLTVLRKGKRQDIKLTPAERPAKFSVRRGVPDREAQQEWRMLQDALLKRGAVVEGAEDDDPAHEEKQEDLSFMLVMPGLVIPDKVDLPSGLEITISKKGDEKAKVVVKRDEQQWEVDSESLDKLPEDIRPHVRQMLGQGAEMRIQLGEGKLGFDWTKRLPGQLIAPRIITRSLKIPPNKVYELHRMEKQLQEDMQEKIREQLEQARQTVEKAGTQIPAEALEKIENELRSLRQQLEQLRRDQTEQAEEED
jgi:hypothetical protein